MLCERLGEKNLYLCHILVQSHLHTRSIQALQWAIQGACAVWRRRRTFSINVRTWTVFSAPLHVFPSLNDEPTITASAVKKSSMLPTAIPDPSNTGSVACALSSAITNSMCRELGSALCQRAQYAPFIEILGNRSWEKRLGGTFDFPAQLLVATAKSCYARFRKINQQWT